MKNCLSGKWSFQQYISAGQKKTFTRFHFDVMRWRHIPWLTSCISCLLPTPISLSFKILAKVTQKTSHNQSLGVNRIIPFWFCQTLWLWLTSCISSQFLSQSFFWLKFSLSNIILCSIIFQLCNNYFNDDVLKLHCQYYHSINENNYFLRELFSPDNTSKSCDECKINLKIAGWKKVEIFCFISNRQEAAGTSNYH